MQRQRLISMIIAKYWACQEKTISDDETVAVSMSSSMLSKIASVAQNDETKVKQISLVTTKSPPPSPSFPLYQMMEWDRWKIEKLLWHCCIWLGVINRMFFYGCRILATQYPKERDFFIDHFATHIMKGSRQKFCVMNKVTIF